MLVEQPVLTERIESDPRVQVAELRLAIEDGEGAHDDGRRRPVEMKQRVDVRRAGMNRADVAGAQELGPARAQSAEHTGAVDRLASLEFVFGMDARARQHLEGAGKAVLMDGHRPVDPIKDLDEESIALGNANKEIAAQLRISDETVKSHVTNILEKLGANDRTHAVTTALRRGIIAL